MIGLDTSVVMRLLVGVPEGQARVARRRLERAVQSAETVLVCDLVIAAAYYALQHHYGMPKAAARALLLRFVKSGAVEVEPFGTADALAETGGPGLVDRLIHTRYRIRNALLLTFERKQSPLEGVVRLPAR